MNKRGLSMIVTTLILILLVLVATGIFWFVIKNIIQGGVGGFELNTKCLDTNVKATAISCIDEVCDIELTRTGSDNDELAGVKLVFFNETENSEVIESIGNIETLVKKTITINSTLSAPNKIEVTVYFEDESGNEKICSQTTTSDIGGAGSVDEGGENGGGEEDEFVCGNDVVEGNEECDGGDNCIAPGQENECTCEQNYSSTDPISVDCQLNLDIVCDGIFEGNEECDGGDNCIAPGQENECTCPEGYESNLEGGCIIQTNVNNGIVGSVWPLDIGLYFDSEDLPKSGVDYSGYYISFSGAETDCLLIAGYFNPTVPEIYNLTHIRFNFPSDITSGDSYEIWKSQGCGG